MTTIQKTVMGSEDIMILLVEAIDIFEKIQNTSSKNDKEKIIKENQYNHVFLKMLNFLYNPFITTGIKDKKLSKAVGIDQESMFDTILEVMVYIEKNNSGKMEYVLAISSFINKFAYEEHREFLVKFFTKTYKCGITSKTINKALGDDYIPEFNVMLAKKYEDEEHKVKSFTVTKKLDGIRCLAIIKDGGVKFFTRQGQPIEGLVEIEEELLFRFTDRNVFDGELLLNNTKGLKSDELFRETQKVVRKDGIKKDIIFNVFDGLPLDDFLKGKSMNVYSIRRSLLHLMFDGMKYSKYPTEHQRVKLVPIIYIGNDKDVIYELLNSDEFKNEEGLMVNNNHSYYVTKRTDGLLKVKQMQTVDLRIIGYEEGTGKNVGKLGALVVDYKGYKVKVGSGYTDEDRESIWNSREDMIGKIIETQYFEESNNQDGGISVRFPVFKQIRDDKTEPSLY